ncbi:MAG TPA: anti-sigma factor [Candidatus Dormibacteraeota bacterium]|nr:anti-sigma factor [Candidatus Dormibacteraeota bacterium]
MTCDDVELTLALASMGDVDAEALQAARAHARTCERCAIAERQYAAMFDVVAVAAVPGGPPPELRRRILDAVSPQPRGEARVNRATQPWWRSVWERVPSGRPLTVAGFAGSAAAVALAVALVLQSRGASPVVTEPVQAGLNQLGLSGTLTYIRDSGDALVSLRGLSATPRTASGAAAVYELWLMRGDGSVAPAGTLSEQPDGTWRAVVHRQAPAQVAVAATVEPAPGTQAPTGDQVFQAVLPQS